MTGQALVAQRARGAECAPLLAAEGSDALAGKCDRDTLPSRMCLALPPFPPCPCPSMCLRAPDTHNPHPSSSLILIPITINGLNDC
eukprot:scaffold6843_cov149-Isochrysis_galbana.AAC.5